MLKIEKRYNRLVVQKVEVKTSVICASLKLLCWTQTGGQRQPVPQNTVYNTVDPLLLYHN